MFFSTPEKQQYFINKKKSILTGDEQHPLTKVII